MSASLPLRLNFLMDSIEEMKGGLLRALPRLDATVRKRHRRELIGDMDDALAVAEADAGIVTTVAAIATVSIAIAAETIAIATVEIASFHKAGSGVFPTLGRAVVFEFFIALARATPSELDGSRRHAFADLTLADEGLVPSAERREFRWVGGDAFLWSEWGAGNHHETRKQCS
jgi:hypothetical protein